jgi:hypothetical protein
MMANQNGDAEIQKAEISVSRIEQKIYLIRGQRVMLDADLAELYGVKTKIVNKAVKRNLDRFPEDFMFQLNKEELERLRFQNGTSKTGRGGSRYLPYAFTAQGVAMLSGVLTSSRAITVNVEIMRAFVRLRQVLSSHRELARKLEELERHLRNHDKEIQTIFEAIRQLMAKPDRIGKRLAFI